MEPIEVAAPPAAPPRPRTTLRGVARTDFSGEDPRWVNGITWVPESCGAGGAFDPTCTPEGTGLKAIPTREGDNPEYQPFVVWAGDKCSADSQWQRIAERTQRLLEAIQDFQIESEFWRGDLAQASDPDWPNLFLASDDADVLATGSQEAPDALALLEQGFASCQRGQRGMIHAPRSVVTLWQEKGLLRHEGGFILTALDTIVVPGSGYDGSGPGGTPATPGSVWAYATGLVDVRLDRVINVPDAADIRSALDRSTNTVEFRAERYVAATWDGCCHLAVEVDAPAPSIGGS